MGNYDIWMYLIKIQCVIPLREKMGNYDLLRVGQHVPPVIPLREKMGNYDWFWLWVSVPVVIPLREKMGNNDNVSAPNIPWWFHRILYPHFLLASIPQMERNVFNKNSPWKWMLPSLEFPWQALIRMTAEMQFAFWFTKRKQFSLDIGRLRRYNIPVSETGL